VAVCWTGRDLFVPLVVLRAPEEGVGALLHRALHPGWTYRVVTTPALRAPVQRAMLVGLQQINAVYTLDPAVFRPVINAMVQPGEGPFRFEIHSGGQVAAAAGVNWQSDRMAEMYVYTDPDFRARGWGKAVGAACIKALLEARLLPLYTTAEENVASRRLAHSLGFQDSGARELECQGQLHS
jgi:RimJ/RimL family protein N-acetyltransferase